MRMWMVDTNIMCRKHLLGEHVETHMMLGTMRKGYGIAGYIRNNCVEPRSIKTRHDALATEMIQRGYNHESPMDEIVFGDAIKSYGDYLEHIINVEKSMADLLGRCPKCLHNMHQKEKGKYAINHKEV